ncbi:MAG TPA: lytic transglycosylase domain-containing protein [Limnobacter sp.]|nr:lytic transglycosylase domain-containing protein [Limnobacter sp.]
MLAAYLSKCRQNWPSGRFGFNTPSPLGRRASTWVFACLLTWVVPATASQQYEPMADHVRLVLRQALASGDVVPRPLFDSAEHRIHWLGEMSRRLARRVPNFEERLELIKTIRYEAQRAGLDPQLVFALIEVESNFNAQARSHAGAIGLMQVMPFWTDVLSRGRAEELLEPRINIRYGCLILRHYLDMEKGNLDRALGRYNGSLGKMTYPNLVYDRLDRNWHYRQPAPGAPSTKTASNP